MIHAACITYTSSDKEAASGLPQQGVSFLTDRNSWNANGTPNFRTVRQALKTTAPARGGSSQ